MYKKKFTSIKLLTVTLLVICLANPAQAMTKRAYRNFKKANELYMKNDIFKAELKYLKAEELSPDDPLIPLKMAEMYASTKNWDKALEYYQKVIRLSPNDGNAYINIADILRTQKKYKEAYNAYKQAGTVMPQENRLYLYLGQVAELLEEDDTAIEHYKKFLSSYPAHYDARRDLAVLYLNNNKNQEAMTEFEALLKTSPAAFNEWENYLKSMLLTENYAKIFEYLDAAYAKQPQNAQIRAVAGAAYFETKNNKKAIEEYQNALKLDPELFGLYFDLGRASENIKQHDDAIKYYEIYLNKYPDSTETYYALSRVYEKKRDYSGSIKVLSKLKEVEKEDVKVLKEIGRNYYMSGDFKKALEYYQEALMLAPQNGEISAKIYYDMAQCYILLKDDENTILSYEKSIAANSNNGGESNEKAKKELAGIYLSLGDKFYDEGKNEEALVQYKKVMDLEPQNFDAVFNSGLIYFETEKSKQAREFLALAGEINPNYAMIYYMLGVLSDKEKDYVSAIENYRKFIELDSENENVGKIKKRISIIEQTQKNAERKSLEQKSVEQKLDEKKLDEPKPKEQKREVDDNPKKG